MRVLALYGLNTPSLRLYQPDTPEIVTLRELKTRRDQVQQMLIAESNRLEPRRRRLGFRVMLEACLTA